MYARTLGPAYMVPLPLNHNFYSRVVHIVHDFCMFNPGKMLVIGRSNSGPGSVGVPIIAIWHWIDGLFARPTEIVLDMTQDGNLLTKKLANRNIMFS
jgi:hypothetical protein